MFYPDFYRRQKTNRKLNISKYSIKSYKIHLAIYNFHTYAYYLYEKRKKKWHIQDVSKEIKKTLKVARACYN